MFNQFAPYEDQFRDWRRDGLPGLRVELYRFIEALTSTDDDQLPRDGTLWPHQWEAFRVVYAHEILGKKELGANGLLLNVVTGGGKTAVIAAAIAWLRVSHGVNRFVLLCLNLIVAIVSRKTSIEGKCLRSGPHSAWASGAARTPDLSLPLWSRQGRWLGDLVRLSVTPGNIHQFYLSNRSGQSNISGLMNGPDFALFNDEAHNSARPGVRHHLAHVA